MDCRRCNQALVAGQAFCPRCGLASGYVAGAQTTPYSRSWLPPLALIERRLNGLAIGWFIYAALIGLAGLAGLAFAHAWADGHDWYGHGWDEHVHRFGVGPISAFWLFKFARGMLVVRVGLALAAGWGLMHKATWGRWMAVVAGCLALIHFPLGTVIGVWTLVLLLNGSNAAAYEAMAE